MCNEFTSISIETACIETTLYRNDREPWGFMPRYGTQHRDEAQTEIDLKFHLLPLKCPKHFWKNDEHVPAYNMSVHMVRQHVT